MAPVHATRAWPAHRVIACWGWQARSSGWRSCLTSIRTHLPAGLSLSSDDTRAARPAVAITHRLEAEKNDRIAWQGDFPVGSTRR